MVYKIGSKMIANRIKHFLNDIISPTQSAFVPRLLITDNVLVGYEINHFLKRRTIGSKQYMALILDVNKAYHMVEWIFLHRVSLNGMGFEGTTKSQYNWRACLEIIPTKAALVRRHVATNPFCDFCVHVVETETHTFFLCLFFEDIWQKEPFLLPTPVPAQNFARVFLG